MTKEELDKICDLWRMANNPYISFKDEELQTLLRDDTEIRNIVVNTNNGSITLLEGLCDLNLIRDMAKAQIEKYRQEMCEAKEALEKVKVVF